jgi:hypothetical protein
MFESVTWITLVAPASSYFSRLAGGDLEGMVAKYKHGQYASDREQTTLCKIRNPRCSQWAGREELFERDRTSLGAEPRRSLCCPDMVELLPTPVDLRIEKVWMNRTWVSGRARSRNSTSIVRPPFDNAKLKVLEFLPVSHSTC